MAIQAFLKSASLFVLKLYKKTTADITVKTLAFSRRLNIHSALAIAGILGPLMWVISDLTAGLSTPNYSLIQNSISSLALTRIGWLQTIGFLVLGLLVEIFAAGLLFNVKRKRWFHLGVGIFVIWGFALLLIGAFHTDPVGVTRTLEGRIHGMTASTAFEIFPLALLSLMPSIKRDDNWKDLYRYTGIAFILAVLLLVTIKIVQEKSGWFGLAERLLVWNMILWVEVSAVNLFIISLKRGEEKKLNQEVGEDF